MLSNTKLGYFVGNGQYFTEEFPEPVELVALHGNIACDRGGNVIKHIHCGIAFKDKQMKGGHLVDANVWAVVEMMIEILPDDAFLREYNKDTGLLGLRTSGSSVPE